MNYLEHNAMVTNHVMGQSCAPSNREQSRETLVDLLNAIAKILICLISCVSCKNPDWFLVAIKLDFLTELCAM